MCSQGALEKNNTNAKLSVLFRQTGMSALNIAFVSQQVLLNDFLNLMRKFPQKIQKFMFRFRNVQATRDSQTTRHEMGKQLKLFQKSVGKRYNSLKCTI